MAKCHGKESHSFVKPKPLYTDNYDKYKTHYAPRNGYKCTQCDAKAMSLRELKNHKFDKHAY